MAGGRISPLTQCVCWGRRQAESGENIQFPLLLGVTSRDGPGVSLLAVSPQLPAACLGERRAHRARAFGEEWGVLSPLHLPGQHSAQHLIAIFPLLPQNSKPFLLSLPAHSSWVSPVSLDARDHQLRPVAIPQSVFCSSLLNSEVSPQLVSQISLIASVRKAGFVSMVMVALEGVSHPHSPPYQLGCSRGNFSLSRAAFPTPEPFDFVSIRPLGNSSTGRNNKNTELDWILTQPTSTQLYWCVRYVHTISAHDKEAPGDLWMLAVDIAYLKLVMSAHNSRLALLAWPRFPSS